MTAPSFDARPMVGGGAGDRPETGADSRQAQATAPRNPWAAILAGPACLPGHDRIPGARPAPIAKPVPGAAACHG